ncbi:hypothetical protein PENTCL1PPCAC_21072, partial [Pristionchus entomophagus]
SGEPAISCTECQANNAKDCTGPTCQGNYCIYELTTPDNGVPHVRRSCSLHSYAVYPDGTRTVLHNECERKSIFGTSYAIDVCNTGSFCDTMCSGSLNFSLLSILIISVIGLIMF